MPCAACQKARRAIKANMREMEERDRAFIEESRFAKVVRTAHGDALLIGDYVIELRVPDLNPLHHINFATAIATALRSQIGVVGVCNTKITEIA